MVLGRADEHFDHVIVQAVVELALERPLKLRMIEIPRMKFEVIGVHRNWRISKLYENFHRLAFGTGGEIQQRMFVEF